MVMQNINLVEDANRKGLYIKIIYWYVPGTIKIHLYIIGNFLTIFFPDTC